MNLKDNWYLINRQAPKRKPQGCRKVFAGASVAEQVDFRALFVLLDFRMIQLHPSEQNGRVIKLIVDSVLVGAVDDEAESGGEGSKELDHGLIFLSADPVQFWVNERLHGVDVNYLHYSFVLWIAQLLRSQRSVHVFF